MVSDWTADEVTAIPLARRCSNAERVWHLRKSCLESDQDLDKMLVSVKALNYILVDDQRKLLYCSMPKIASTSMKVFLFKLSGMHKDQKILSMVHLPKHYPKFGYRNLASYTSTEAQYRLRNYYKYLFVRHPFDRIASTWREKLVEKNVYIPKLALKIIDKYRTIPAENGSIFEKVPTLPEFAEFIGDNANASNEHWNSIENLCDPCHVRYDYIVRVESMADDIVDILSLHGHNLTLDEHQNYHGRKAELQLRVRFETFDELAKRAISALRHRYEPDFKHFGYEFTDSGELVCEINSPEGACC